jgi:hypothetical protein
VPARFALQFPLHALRGIRDRVLGALGDLLCLLGQALGAPPELTPHFTSVRGRDEQRDGGSRNEPDAGADDEAGHPPRRRTTPESHTGERVAHAFNVRVHSSSS